LSEPYYTPENSGKKPRLPPDPLSLSDSRPVQHLGDPWPSLCPHEAVSGLYGPAIASATCTGVKLGASRKKEYPPPPPPDPTPPHPPRRGGGPCLHRLHRSYLPFLVFLLVGGAVSWCYVRMVARSYGPIGERVSRQQAGTARATGPKQYARYKTVRHFVTPGGWREPRSVTSPPGSSGRLGNALPVQVCKVCTPIPTPRAGTVKSRLVPPRRPPECPPARTLRHDFAPP
jgi:hypothetical protein